MNTETNKELLLRVADWLDLFSVGTGENCDLDPEEARTISRVLREAEEGWKPIETAPHEVVVLLAWRDSFLPKWNYEAGFASHGTSYPNGASSMSFHGQATHWHHLPPPPSDAAKTAAQADYEQRSAAPSPSTWNAGAEAMPSSLDQPRAWWAETGTAGTGEGCNRPFWLRHEAVAYVQQHGGYVAPLFRRYEPPQHDGMILMPVDASEEMLAATHDNSGHMRLMEFTKPEERSKPFLIMRACYRAMVDHVRKGGPNDRK